ncbi:hypothetical protein AAVH_26657 [Aphelenchoides avenae]|nr:hypothetical protein AAVH_26657 [Aphelenchus avenae]
MGMRLSTAVFSSSDRPAPRSTGSGLALLSADEWLDVAPYLDYYNNATMRFASGALNRLVHRNSFALPRRVIQAVVVYTDAWEGHDSDKNRYSAEALAADWQTRWRDLKFEDHETPEAILLEVLVKCKGLHLSVFDMLELDFNARVVNVMTQHLPFITVSDMLMRRVDSGHAFAHQLLEIPVHGLRYVWFENDAENPDAAAVLSVCAARKIHAIELRYVADVTDMEILDFLFNNDSADTVKSLVVERLQRSLADDFFETVIEVCFGLSFSFLGRASHHSFGCGAIASKLCRIC